MKDDEVYINKETKKHFCDEIKEMKKESKRVKHRQTKPIKKYQTK